MLCSPRVLQAFAAELSSRMQQSQRPGQSAGGFFSPSSMSPVGKPGWQVRERLEMC